MKLHKHIFPLMMLTVSIVLVTSSFRNNNSGEDILKKMYKRYAGNWYKSFTFTQTTESYRNDSLIRTATWYESIVFPDKFRIDFGKAEDGNAAIFTPDSVYRFSKGKLARITPNDDDLTFLLGGMYFMPFEEVKVKMKKMGYDPANSYETSWKGSPVYVIGASGDKDSSNQLWIDQQKLVPVRFVKQQDGHREEGIFYNHQPFGKAWSETACDFYIDGKLLQKEKYYDCKANVEVDLKIFDPAQFIFRQ